MGMVGILLSPWKAVGMDGVVGEGAWALAQLVCQPLATTNHVVELPDTWLFADENKWLLRTAACWLPTGAGANPSQLSSLEADMAQYKQERAAVMRKIEELEELEVWQLTDVGRKELQRLQQKEQSLLDLIKELQQEKILLLRSAGEPLALSMRRGVLHIATGPCVGQGCMFVAEKASCKCVHNPLITGAAGIEAAPERCITAQPAWGQCSGHFISCSSALKQRTSEVTQNGLCFDHLPNDLSCWPHAAADQPPFAPAANPTQQPVSQPGGCSWVGQGLW
jgi:hypothetical protein